MRKLMCWRTAVVNVTLTAIMLCGLLLAVQPANANTITFNDVSGVGVSQTGSDPFTCATNSCTVTELAPSGSHLSSVGFGNPLLIADTNGTTVSDEFTYTPIIVVGPPIGISLTFTSDDSGTGALLGNCPVAGCPITETGAVQGPFSVSWSNGTTDSIFFQSTADGTLSSTPEPSSLLLLATGLLGVGGMVRRKLLS